MDVMKKTHIIFGILALGATVVEIMSCKKNFKDVATEKSSVLSSLAGRRSCDCEIGRTVTLSGVITSDTLLDNCTEWHLDGLVYVAGNATMTIEAGTRVEGLLGTGGNPGGGLIITRGSKLIADGTEECPIVFTSVRWDSTGASAPQSGDWAGIVLLGNAPTNQINPRIEGIPANPPASPNYGGDNCNDTSGILRYVRIEYPGYELSANNEINGLTLGGVGCGTVIDYVEVYKSRDDAFEFFGGTVNATHLVVVDPLDDMFDFDFGYTGRIQFALGLADTTRADISQSNGIESDNENNPPNHAAGPPQTFAQLSNFTLIGVEDATRANRVDMPPSVPPTGSYGRAAHIRRNSGIALNNSLFMGWKWGISLDGPGSQGKMLAPPTVSCFENNIVHAFTTPFITEGPAGTWVPGVSNASSTDPDPNADIQLTSPFVRQIPDFVLPIVSPASPALRNAFYGNCFTGGCCNFTFTNTTGYIGAFGSYNWAQDITYGGWVKYY